MKGKVVRSIRKKWKLYKLKDLCSALNVGYKFLRMEDATTLPVNANMSFATFVGVIINQKKFALALKMPH